MDLKIKDVAELLNVTEDMIKHLISEGKIPFYKLNKQYRFDRAEIENWVMCSSTDLEEVLERKISQTDNKKFSLYRAIHRGGVHFNVNGKNKEEVIRESVKLIAKELNLDADVISEILLDREKLASTALGSGIAVPHARDFLLQKPFDFVSVVFTKNPIEYDALDGKPVHTLFFLFAGTDKMHLHLLSKIAYLSSDTEALALLSHRVDKSDFLSFLKNWESGISKK